jgi:translation initiation factor 1 (eIF-1/SUI1)
MIKSGKKQKASQPSSSGLSTSFALALWFGTNAEGTALLVDGQHWALVGLFFASHLLLSDNVISVNSDKKKKLSTTLEGDENQIEAKEEGVQLRIVVTKKDSGKKNTVKLNLSNMKFINKFIINKFKDKFSTEGIDLEEIYLQAKENPEVGVILDVEHENQHVVISIE